MCFISEGKKKRRITFFERAINEKFKNYYSFGTGKNFRYEIQVTSMLTFFFFYGHFPLTFCSFSYKWQTGVALKYKILATFCFHLWINGNTHNYYTHFQIYSKSWSSGAGCDRVENQKASNYSWLILNFYYSFLCFILTNIKKERATV